MAMSLRSTFGIERSSAASASAAEAASGDHGALTLQNELQDLADVPVVVHEENTDAGERALVLPAAPACLRFAPRASSAASASGSSTVKVAPCFSPGLSARTWPPWSSTRSFTSARPTPSPPCARVLELSAWRKRSKRFGRTSAADARATVDHLDPRQNAGALEADFDTAAVRRELDGVRDEVRHDLAQPMRIGDERRDRFVEGDFELGSTSARPAARAPRSPP